MGERITGARLRAMAVQPGPARIASLYREHINQVASQLDEAEALRPDAEEWRAVQAILRHPQVGLGAQVHMTPGGRVWCDLADRGVAAAPTPRELLAKLDALGAEKPMEPEDWRWEWPDGQVSEISWPRAAYCREAHPDMDGRPVRRIVNADGSVTLKPEGVE